MLRWIERCPVVFNRLYLACLWWNLLGMALILGVAAWEGHLRPPYVTLLSSGLLRVALVLDMLIGVMLLWRLVPRIDAHRIRPGSACMAVAVIMAISFGVATSLACDPGRRTARQSKSPRASALPFDLLIPPARGIASDEGRRVLARSTQAMQARSRGSKPLGRLLSPGDRTKPPAGVRIEERVRVPARSIPASARRAGPTASAPQPVPLAGCHSTLRTYPHPALRATFSRREKDQVSQASVTRPNSMEITRAAVQRAQPGADVDETAGDQVAHAIDAFPLPFHAEQAGFQIRTPLSFGDIAATPPR